MRPGLVGKLVLLSIAIVACGLAVQAALDVRRVHELHRAELQGDMKDFGVALAGGVRELWRSSGEQAARRLLRGADTPNDHIHVRWLEPGAPDDTESDDGSRLRLHIPVSVSGRVVGTIELTRSLASHRDFLNRLLESKAIIAAGLLLLCGALIAGAGVWLLRRPLRRLTRQVEQIGASQFSPNPEVGRGDEIGALARAMNRMAEQLEQAQNRSREERRRRTATLEQLRHADRLATVGKIASGIAHQLGTPLNVVTGRAAMIASSDVPEQVRKDARAINGAAENMAQIIQQLLHFSRRRGLQVERARVREVLKEAENLVGPIAERNGVDILVTGSDSVEAAIDVGRVLQVLTNVMMNGVQAMPEGGTLALGVRRQHVAEPPEKRSRPGDYVCITVEDEGFGLSTQELDRIFEPFFSPLDGRKAGLGLSVSHGIVRQHGGWIQIESEPGRGSRIEIYLPQENEG